MAPKNAAAPYLGQKRADGKVWAGDGWGWQAPATYTRLAGQGQLNTQRNPLQWLDNNLRHLGATTKSLDKGTKFVGLAGAIPIYEDSKGQFSTTTPTQRQVVHGSTVQPLTNAALAATNLGQRLLSGQPLTPRKPENTGAGKAILNINRQAAIGMGAKPIEQLDQSQRDLLSSLPSSLATNTALAFVGPLRAGGAAIGGLASRVPFLSAGAQQVLARGLSWGTNAAVNEAASGILDDSTQGQAGDLLKAMGAPVPDAFLTKPEDDRISAGVKGIIPGIAFGEVLGLPLGVGTKVAELAPNALRNLREQRVGADVSRARQETVAAGIQTPDGSGGYGFTADRAAAAAPATAAPAAASAAPAAAPAATPAAAPAAAVDAVDGAAVDAAPVAAVEPVDAGAADAGLSEAPAVPVEAMPDTAAGSPLQPELEVDEGITYDPSLPEVDVPALAMQRLDDEGLQAVAQGQGPVLDRLEGVLSQQQLPEPALNRSLEVTAAPTSSLAEPATPWREQWEALPNQELLGMAHPDVSPELYQRTQALSGRSWEELSRDDVLDGLSALQQEGTTVLPQRLGEGPALVDVNTLGVDPGRLQFRSGADPETGVVPGQEIQGGWDPSQEGAIKTWQDPTTGETLVVDGHRRVEAAQRLGIRTLPAEELASSSADAARIEGAVTNINQGTASPADAAGVMREMGITDPADLEANGIPLEQGAPGLALARLPQSVNGMVEQGALPAPRAEAIGASGLDEAGMRNAARFSRTQAGQSLSDAEFAEVMSLSGSRLADDPLSKVTGIQQELDGTGRYDIGPVKIERETYDNGGSRTTVEVGTNGLPADWLAQRGIADPASVSKIRQTTLLRDYTMERLRELPPGEYALDALDDARARIYRRWFDGGKVPGITEADSALLKGTSWTYRPEADPKALVNQQAKPKAPTSSTFSAQINRARLQAAVREQLPVELQTTFDQLKTDPASPIGLLLDQGAAELGSGAISDVVARRVAMQVEQGAAAAPAAGGAAAAPAVEAPAGPMTAADRAALRAQLLQEAIANGEVRPSAQPMIPAPDAPAVDVPRAVADLEEQLRTTGTVAPDTPAAQLLEEEARLAAEYQGRDAVIQAEVQRARREAAGFWQLSFDERLSNGLIGEGWTQSSPAKGAVRSGGSALTQLIASLRTRLGLGNEVRELPAGTAIFHGTSKEAARRIQEAGFEAKKSGTFPRQAGVYFALNPEYAKAYADYGLKPGEVVAGVLPDGARVLDLTGTTLEKFQKQKSIKGSVIGWAKEQGYTGLAYKPDADRLNGYKGKDTTEVFLFDATGANQAVGVGGQVLESSGAPQGWGSVETSPVTLIPAEAVKPYESLTKFEEARAVSDLSRALGTNDAGLNQNGGYTYAKRKMELLGHVDLDAVFGAEKAAKAREQFRSRELGPEAVEVRESLREFYGFKPTTAEKAFYIELGGDDAAINEVSNTLRETVRLVAGPDADVRLADQYRYGATPLEWGGDGKRVGRTHGSYHLMKDIVEINGVLDGTQTQLMGTAYHEAFHRVQYGLLTPQEMKVLDSAFGLQRINNYSGLSPDKVSSMERMAVAFQNYAVARRMGGDVMQEKMIQQLESQLKEPLGEGAKKAVVQVATAFEKVLDFIDRIKNFAQGNGFQTVDDIFEKVYSGQIAQQRAFDSALELLTPNQVERAKTLQRWRKDNKAPLQDITKRVSDLDAQIESLKAKATAGGC